VPEEFNRRRSKSPSSDRRFPRGWKIHEPEGWAFEKSDWMNRQVLRLLAEGIIDKNEAERLMDQKLEVQEPDSLVKRKEFIKLPVEKRRELLAEQALSMAKHYVEALPKQEIIGGGEVIDY
jgi:hypothetical protein